MLGGCRSMHWASTRTGTETTRPSMGCTIPSHVSWKRRSTSLIALPSCLRPEEHEAEGLEPAQRDVVEALDLLRFPFVLEVDRDEAIAEVLLLLLELILLTLVELEILERELLAPLNLVDDRHPL